MNILISNDDGVWAHGLHALVKALSKFATVTVVAPDCERSGSSSALTLDRPLTATQLSNGFWSVNGTPADCVYLALNGLFATDQQHAPFDLLVTGINSGANLADDVLYSGTVGAGFEGRHLPYTSLAVSLVGQHVRGYQSIEDYAQSADWIAEFIRSGVPRLPEGQILNVNIPDVPVIKGAKFTRMGKRDRSLPIVTHQNPRGNPVHWIGLAGAVNSAHTTVAHRGFMADFEAVNAGFVSLTPIQMDCTDYESLAQLSGTDYFTQDNEL